MQWLGVKRVAFIPVDRGAFNEPPGPPPSDWQEQIERRILFELDPVKGVDVSLRNYIHTVSQGRADLLGQVLPIYQLEQKEVPPDFLASEFEQSLRDQGFDAGALVMIGGRGAGVGDLPGFWARFVMEEGVGVWAMELTHPLTRFADLYSDSVPHHLGTFDNMACNCGTHLTAYSKVQLGWLDQSAIVLDSSLKASFSLHSLALVQPPPPERVTAVQIATGGYPLFVEARQRVDQYDGGNQWNNVGIAGEGVIVYEIIGVENPAPWPGEIDPLISLLTPTPLSPGQSLTSNSGVTIEVTAALTGGFAVSITNPKSPVVAVPDVLEHPPMEAALEVKNAGLVPVFGSGSGQWVKTQSPDPGKLVPRGSTVAMSVGSGPKP